MKPSDIAMLTGTVVCMCAVPAFGQNSKHWVNVESPTELRALYSNKTFHGNGANRYWVAYLKSDGTGLLVTHNQERIPRTWVVKGDEVCVTDPKATNCYQFMRNPANPHEYFGRRVDKGWTFYFTVEDGVPKF